ncbi:MAG: DUF2167 domain-containing protein [Kofleriaceae bacterium]
MSLRLIGVWMVLAWCSVAMAGGKQDRSDNRAGDEPDAAEAQTGEHQVQWPKHLVGPQLVDLGHNIEFDLPDGVMLLERAEAQEIIRNDGGDAEDVLAVLTTPNSTWIVVIEYDGDLGYITDSDADELDADDLLASYRESTRVQNGRRKEMGLPGLVVDRWSERPRYDRVNHHLVWGLAGHDDAGAHFINHFTRILGRSGYLSFNLIDDPARIEASKREAAALVPALRFKPGARYSDHAPGDHSSGAGLKTLVLGGAGVAVASKVGLLAKILLLLKKVGVFLVVAIGGLLKWLLGRKKDQVPPGPPSDLSAPSA